MYRCRNGSRFPGIPLKIVYPEIDFVLVDSLNKRVKFLKDVKEALGLEGLEALHGRAEDLARDKSLRAALIYVFRERLQT